MKKCPFCAEEIQDEAVKCKHCNEFLVQAARPVLGENKLPWYFRTTFIVIAVGCVGPLALPLIWWRPQTKRGWKIGLTIGVLVLTWLLILVTIKAVQSLRESIQMLNGL